MGDRIGNRDNYTHVTFFYDGGAVLTVSKAVHLSVYPYETAQRIVYTIQK